MPICMTTPIIGWYPIADPIIVATPLFWDLFRTPLFWMQSHRALQHSTNLYFFCEWAGCLFGLLVLMTQLSQAFLCQLQPLAILDDSVRDTPVHEAKGGEMRLLLKEMLHAYIRKYQQWWGDLNKLVDYRDLPSTVYNDGKISTCE